MNRKIDPVRRPACHPDGIPRDNDKVEIGPTQLAYDEWAALGLALPDLDAMREYRLQRVVAQLHAHDLAGVLCFDPVNIRYATDTSNMQVWVLHNTSRAVLVMADGHVALWDYTGTAHLSAHLPRVKELRHGAGFCYFLAGERMGERAQLFADDVAEVVKAHAGSNRRLAVDRVEWCGTEALTAAGFALSDAQPVMELARVIKSDDEIRAMRCAIAVTDKAVEQMQQMSLPGVTENDVWAVLHAENIRRGGEWVECRLLSSGPRTNPWFQECGPRVLQVGDLLALDTDLIGPYGMCADFSRTWLIGDVTPDAEQRECYLVAYEHIMENAALLRPGMSFNEIVEKAHRLPEKYRAQRYGVMYHGIGMCDEYPSIYYPEDHAASGYDGVLEPGMALTTEAYVGEVGGKHGVKLENQLLVTDTGVEVLSQYPFEDALLG